MCEEESDKILIEVFKENYRSENMLKAKDRDDKWTNIINDIKSEKHIAKAI
jgi:hypothetical protein